jgi:hypothetical protein
VAKKNLRVAYSDRAEGPYGAASEPISVDWVEGPSVLRIGIDWVVFYDEYTRKQYGAIRSKDLKNWEVITGSIEFPPGARHGSAFPASKEIVGGLIKAFKPRR